MIFLSGYNIRLSKRDYWNPDLDLRCGAFCETMNRNRFFEIKLFYIPLITKQKPHYLKTKHYAIFPNWFFQKELLGGVTTLKPGHAHWRELRKYWYYIDKNFYYMIDIKTDIDMSMKYKRGISIKYDVPWLFLSKSMVYCFSPLYQFSGDRN